MNLFDDQGSNAATSERAPIPLSALDHALTAQLIVAWAGESGEEPRLGWWRSDLVSEFGGEDLFRRLLPNTWEWAVLQGAREAARRKDVELRSQDHDPDQIISLFSFGFELDERVEERLQDLKRSGHTPREALPGLVDIVDTRWDRDRFIDWIQGHGEVDTTVTPIGRRIKASVSTGDLDTLVQRLVGAIAPVGETYPLPHARRSA